MRPVGMGGDNKSIFALGESHCQFITHLVGFFGGNLTGLERLSYLISDDVASLAAPSGPLIQLFGKHKLLVHGQRTALVVADQFALLSLVWILRIVGAVFQTGGDGSPFVLMQWNQTSRRQDRSPQTKKPPEGGKNKSHSSVSHSLNRSMPSVIAVAPKKRTKQINSATSRMKN